MAAKRTTKLVLNNAKIVLTSTLFETAGDQINVTVNDNQITLANYTRRHVVLDGSFVASFPNTAEADEIINVQGVWPTKAGYPLSDSIFVVRANANNSLYYCVIPQFMSDQLTVVKTSLSLGQSHTINKGVVGFVFGNQYTVNGIVNTSRGVIACEISSAVIVATQSCTIIEFSIA